MAKSVRRSRALRALSQAQQVSALAFGSFLVVHLSAPALALVAPSSDPNELATGTMLLGRVWYQNALSEPVLVWGALAVHLASSLTRKAILVFWPPASAHNADGTKTSGAQVTEEGGAPTKDRRREWIDSLRAGKRRASLSSDLHTLSGTLLAPFVLHHAFLNRVVPSKSAAPINALSPSELDYTFVAHGFPSGAGALPPARNTYSTLAYAALIGLSAYHTSHGLRKILLWRSQHGSKAKAKARGKSKTLAATTAGSLPAASEGGVPTTSAAQPSGRRSRRSPWDVAAGAAALIVSGGLTRLVQGADAPPAFLFNRYEACYSLVWPDSIL